MNDELRLDELPRDVLFLIFNHCHASDLVRISEVCQRFRNLIAEDVLWTRRRNIPLVTNQASRRFRQRCNILLRLRTRWQVSENWRRGRYEEKYLLTWELKSMPWIVLGKNTLWWSGGNELCAFRRRRNRYSYSCDLFTNAETIFVRKRINSDISKFVVRNDYAISGHSNGAITLWSRRQSRRRSSDLRIENAHRSRVNAVDEMFGVIISGSADGTVKIWSMPIRNVDSVPVYTVDIMDRIWSIATNPINGKFAIGSSGRNGVDPLKILDIERCRESISIRHNWRRGAGILDMLWESSNVLLTCGYDTCIRKWDTRIGSCVAYWMDPTDATIYCISSDYHNTIIAGTQYNCKAVLWDQRMQNFVQLYYLKNVNKTTSPLYSVSFDSSNLYATTDLCLLELNFSDYNYRQRDYRAIFHP